MSYNRDQSFYREDNTLGDYDDGERDAKFYRKCMLQENRTGIPFRQSWDEYNACRDRNWDRTGFKVKKNIVLVINQQNLIHREVYTQI